MITYKQREEMKLTPKNKQIQRLYILAISSMFILVLLWIEMYDQDKIGFLDGMLRIIATFSAMWLLRFIKDVTIIRNRRKIEFKKSQMKQRCRNKTICAQTSESYKRHWAQ